MTEQTANAGIRKTLVAQPGLKDLDCIRYRTGIQLTQGGDQFIG
jgi:hypothetical protein